MSAKSSEKKREEYMEIMKYLFSELLAHDIKIARKTGIELNDVQVYLESLVNLGLVEKKEVGGDEGIIYYELTNKGIEEYMKTRT